MKMLKIIFLFYLIYKYTATYALRNKKMVEKVSYLSVAGLRHDGRRPTELRRMDGRLGKAIHALDDIGAPFHLANVGHISGAASLQQGHTQVLVQVTETAEQV
jgi:hypothetical protein